MDKGKAYEENFDAQLRGQPGVCAARRQEENCRDRDED